MPSAPKLRLLPPTPGENAWPLEFSEVFRQHASGVASLALRLLGSDDEVDDVVQDVFVICARKLGQIRSAQEARPWLATVTVRVARRRLRRRRVRQFLHLSSPEEPQVAARGASPEQLALLSQIYGVIAGLSVNHRLAWCLRHVEGQKLEEVARSCDCSLATAKRWIAAAEHALRGVIDDGS